MANVFLHMHIEQYAWATDPFFQFSVVKTNKQSCYMDNGEYFVHQPPNVGLISSL